MSVDTDVMVDHGMPDFRNREAVIELLRSTVPVLLEVREFWNRELPNKLIESDEWESCLLDLPKVGEYLRYDGPGLFSVHFGARVAVIGSACRWAGFVSIPEMQEVHLKAFREVARVLGGTRMVVIPDNDLVEDLALEDGASLEECISFLERTAGPQLLDKTVYFREPYQDRPQWFVEDGGR